MFKQIPAPPEATAPVSIAPVSIAPVSIAPVSIAPVAGAAGGVPAIRCEGVGKAIGGQPVLTAIDFALQPGETMAIAGVNGAGKTTLLRCLLDFARASEGTLSIFGCDSRVPAARARLAYLPERFLPPAHLTGHETLQWLAGLHGSRWTRAQSDEVAAQFELPEAAMRRRVQRFSKGMVQKLGLAALLHAGRELIVLDEPMSGLDVLARRSLAVLLAQARERGCSVLFTSHAMADIDRLAHRMLVLHRGRQRFLGTPDALRVASGRADLESAFIDCLATE